MMKNIKIGTKIAMVMIIAMIFSIGNLLYTYLNLKSIKENISNIYKVRLLSISFLLEADRDAYQATLGLSHALNREIIKSINLRNAKIKFVFENMGQVLTRFNKFKKKFPDRNNKITKLFGDFDRFYKVWKTDILELKSLIQTNKVAAALKLYFGRYEVNFEKMRNVMDVLTETSHKDAKKEYNVSIVYIGLIEVISLIINIILITYLIVMGIILSRNITNPVKNIADLSIKIAERDLTVQIDDKLTVRYDEIGVLANAYDKMHKSLMDIIEKMGFISANLATSSEEIAASSQNLAEGAQNQSANVEETLASMEELQTTVLQVSENAEEANGKMKELLSTSKESSELVEQAVEGMEKINLSTQQISEILSVINDITDQTSLLALNAAIEAARAGEHGKGFAVVADEIAKLADKSAANSKEINKLIEQSIKDIEFGADIVKKAGDAFNIIIQGVDLNTELMSRIAQAVVQQKSGTEQVQQAVENISEITQSTSASAEEMAASTDELQGQAEKIKTMIELFKISDTNNENTKITYKTNS